MTYMESQGGLFSEGELQEPLASRMRPGSLDGFVGQQHLLASGKPLEAAISTGHLHSFLLWGPPGVGKTTLARIAADAAQAHFVQLSAVLAGVKDIRDAVAEAKARRASGIGTVLFVDEVHRFNKAQQDAFLPHVEDGTLIFIGATTENPSFEVNSALLSRVRTYRLRPLSQEELEELVEKALSAHLSDIDIAPSLIPKIASAADGDGRRVCALLELAADLAPRVGDRRVIDDSILSEIATGSLRRFDKGGDAFYDQISALHKSVRGSAPDASLYWFARLLDGGCDPIYIARRVVRIASEDIGNADPRALELALNAWQVQERLGSPEGELAIAQAITYAACAAKSNAVYVAYKRARDLAEKSGSLEVPLHLRNAPTALMEAEGYGDGYRYDHEEPDGFSAGQTYFPEGLDTHPLYEPVNRGLESKMAEKLDMLRDKTLAAGKKL